jgi:lysophospholipase L1-like esterase
MGDPMPDGTWRGWAALLAESLAPPGELEFHNLATSGARARDVAAVQLPRALAIEPHVVTAVVGINDTLRQNFDPAEVEVSLGATASRLRDAGATVLTISLPDPGRMFGLPRHLAAPLGRRIREINAAAEAVAQRYGTVHWDAANHATTYNRPMWSVDRLHPSERGHRLLATSYYDLLDAAGQRVWRRPSAEPQNAPPSRRDSVWWMASKGTKWFLRRSVDLIPYLLWLAVVDWWATTWPSDRPEPTPGLVADGQLPPIGSELMQPLERDEEAGPSLAVLFGEGRVGESTVDHGEVSPAR